MSIIEAEKLLLSELNRYLQIGLIYLCFSTEQSKKMIGNLGRRTSAAVKASEEQCSLKISMSNCDCPSIGNMILNEDLELCSREHRDLRPSFFCESQTNK